MMSMLIKITLAAGAVYVLIVLAAYFGQRSLIYHPSRTRTPPAEAGLAGVEERTLVMPDGARVLAWYGKARPGEPTILYFHGNAGSLVERAERVRRFMSQGWGVYLMTYRGFGGSTGVPSETANVADARLAHGALVQEGVPPGSIVIYGESLGTGVAVRLAVERPAAGLALEAPYTSVADVGTRVYPYLPVRLLLRDRYESSAYIAQVRIPLLVLHGELDRTIPVGMGREMFRLANEPKRLSVLPRAGHADIYLNGNNALDVMRDWIGWLKRSM